jgi:hypothetical protein
VFKVFKYYADEEEEEEAAEDAAATPEAPVDEPDIVLESIVADLMDLSTKYAAYTSWVSQTTVEPLFGVTEIIQPPDENLAAAPEQPVESS